MENNREAMTMFINQQWLNWEVWERNMPRIWSSSPTDWQKSRELGVLVWALGEGPGVACHQPLLLDPESGHCLPGTSVFEVRVLLPGHFQGQRVFSGNHIGNPSLGFYKAKTVRVQNHDSLTSSDKIRAFPSLIYLFIWFIMIFLIFSMPTLRVSCVGRMLCQQAASLGTLASLSSNFWV